MIASAGAQGVFVIGGPNPDPLTADARAMGFKAYNLARMAAIGLPVPPAFVLSTAFCRDFLQAGEKGGARLR